MSSSFHYVQRAVWPVPRVGMAILCFFLSIFLSGGSRADALAALESAAAASLGNQAQQAGVDKSDQGVLLPRGYGKYSIWQQGIFRIRFMRTGEEAAPSADANGNNCPDYVEDVARQLVAAFHLFCTLGGLVSPLEAPRYAGVRYVDVVIRDGSAMRGLNGIAYDEPSWRPDPQNAAADIPDRELPRVPVLIIALNRAVDPKRNPTPAHEFFHQIQNAMVYSKNSWFYEGMAAWAEDTFSAVNKSRVSAGGRQRLAALEGAPVFRSQVFTSSYAAAGLVWRPLAGLCPEAGIAIGDQDPVLRSTYSDGSPVVYRRHIPGLRLMRRVLEKMSATEALNFGLPAMAQWTEAEQRNPAHNVSIAGILVDAAAGLCPQ